LTFRDLQKLVQSQSEANISHGNGVQKLLDKPFGYLTKNNSNSKQNFKASLKASNMPL
jgi:carbamate kinase